jgi:hypothetical protein
MKRVGSLWNYFFSLWFWRTAQRFKRIRIIYHVPRRSAESVSSACHGKSQLALAVGKKSSLVIGNGTERRIASLLTHNQQVYSNFTPHDDVYELRV